ncbi:threonine ammonia-lyase [Patulibacter defluvii]|uniref:threonine ammonia-lyase n=1 Tax=Patulibacter defluvii TaxID=3095358 RepID=UPI002A764E38|nr:pyridoxal-phosphate dependent enzyme [Patulibacter sp. DM4]
MDAAVDPWAVVDDARRARAAAAIADVVRPTPVLSSRGLSERFGGPIVLKAENLQRTGSFKLRGALAKVAALGPDAAAGVVAGSAGNHAQAVAYAARERGVPCEVFMPEGAPIAKLDACAGLGARVHRGGASVIDAVAAARERAAATGMAFLHPFDDPDVIAGQATVGQELLEQVPDLAQVVVPLGGGGLSCGIALAVKRARPDVRVIGVQAEACAPYLRARSGAAGAVDEGTPTIADGIAVKQPGEVTLPLVEALLDDVVGVDEDAIAEAMVTLLERAKLVVEGAGAVSAAAARPGLIAAPASGTTVLVLSGGNVDPGLVAAIARRHESVVGRRLVLLTVVSDRPGSLARLLTEVGATGANLVEVQHVRDGVALHVRETAVQLALETRGPEHARAVREALTGAGYAVRELG